MSSTGLSYYEAARQEIIERLRLRDHITLSYVISVGAIFSIALNKVGIDEVVPILILIIPYLCLGVAILVSSHSMAITNIGAYVDELAPAINECRKRTSVSAGNKAPIDLCPWDSSKTFKEKGAASSLLRMLGSSCIILMPAIFSQIIGFSHFHSPFENATDAGTLFWIFGTISTIVAAYILNRSHVARKQSVLYKNIYDKIKTTPKNV
jgi:hypothetical protein